ncbi:MAG: glycosyltransferase family 4 protein [Anaerolineae bacterium]|nr:glycosyltransferase family 4 protein [Anaerolineae bacterium]
MNIVMIGPFGLHTKSTIRERALPMARALVERGHQVTILLPPWDCPQDDGQTWLIDGVTVENVRLPPRIPVLWHLSLTFRLVRRALALRPQAIHCFKPKAYAGLSAWVLWQLKKLHLTHVRLIVDTDDWEGRGGWNELAAYSGAQKRMFAWQERWGLRHADAITVASRALQTIVWSMGVPAGAVHYAPNAATADQIPASPARPDPSAPPTVLLYTRFFEFGLERVVDTLHLIHQSRPDARFTVVGKGLFGEQDRFLDLCRAAGLTDVLDYRGWAPPETLPDLFSQAHVALYPFDDTLVNRTKCAVKLRDLLAAGVPVVADAVGENAEMIANRASGLLVRPDSPGAMADAALELLGNPLLRESLGQCAQQYVREHLVWERLIERVENAYPEQKSNDLGDRPYRQSTG